MLITKTLLAWIGFGLILVLMIVFSLPNSSSRQRALEKQRLSILRQVGIGLSAYSTQNGGQYPTRLQELFLKGYMPNDTQTTTFLPSILYFAPTPGPQKLDPNYVLLLSPMKRGSAVYFHSGRAEFFQSVDP